MNDRNNNEKENNGLREKLFQKWSERIANDEEKAPQRKVTVSDVGDSDTSVEILPLTWDTECGISCFRGPKLQRLTNKISYVIVYSFSVAMLTASAAYFIAMSTTIEKRFKLSSKRTAYIASGNYIAQLVSSYALSYYTSNKNKPRWIAIGLYTMVLSCCLAWAPHLIYGAGEDALQLTKEYNEDQYVFHEDTNNFPTEYQEKKFLCSPTKNITNQQCEKLNYNFGPQIIFFIARFFYGVADTVVFTLGLAYLDDNVEKSKTPKFISITYFVKLLGPTIGYGLLAPFALKMYIVPNLTPTITVSDPRWLGAWWVGWIIFASIFFIAATIMLLFPKTLPHAAAFQQKKNKSTESLSKKEKKVSWNDMIKTLKKFSRNGTFVCTNLASVFFVFGFIPYWFLMPKYIEIQFKKSPAEAAFMLGIITVVFSAVGFSTCGWIIQKFKPKGRYLAGYNIFSCTITFIAILCFAFIGCADNEQQLINIQNNQNLLKTMSGCNCDSVGFNPVCSNNGETFISACHAGCQNIINQNGEIIYANCSYIKNEIESNLMSVNASKFEFKTAFPGSCSVDCKINLYIFLAIICLITATSSAGTTPSLLLTLRCVDTKDKAVAMGFYLTVLCLFAFIPSPVMFGYIIDSTCLLWSKSCSETSNCWLHDSYKLKYVFNLTSGAFIGIGIFFYIGVYYWAKDVKIFDEEKSTEKSNDKWTEKWTEKHPLSKEDV